MVHRLEDICKARIAVSICNNSKIKEYIFRIPRYLLNFYFKEENEKALEAWLISLLEYASDLVKSLMKSKAKNRYVLEKVVDFVPFVSVEMLKWAKFHEDHFSLSFEFIENFISSSIFTSQGCVDWEKAARGLMEETVLKPETRFDIACYYSLTDLMMKPWIETLYFMFDQSFSTCASKNIVKAWTEQVIGSNINSVGRKYEKFVFHSSIAAVESESEISFRYFWKHLNEADKVTVVNYFAKNFHQKLKNKPRLNFEYFYLCEPLINMFICLFNDLDNDKKRLLLNKEGFSCLVLQRMLHWPYQSLFLDVANASWDILPKLDFCRLLLIIINKINDPFDGKMFDYRRLLRMFWSKSPEPFKRYIFAEKVSFENEKSDFEKEFDFGINLLLEDRNVLLVCPVSRSCDYFLMKSCTLNFTDEDKGNARFTLKSATNKERSKVFGNDGEDISDNIIKNGNIRSVKLFLESCKINFVNYIKSLEFYDDDDKLKVLDQYECDILDVMLKRRNTPRIETIQSLEKIFQCKHRLPIDPESRLLDKSESRLPSKPKLRLPSKPKSRLPSKPKSRLPSKPESRLPSKPESRLPSKPKPRLFFKSELILPRKPKSRLLKLAKQVQKKLFCW